MRITIHSAIEPMLTPGHAIADPAGQQRRLGRVYRLILNYDPKKKAATQGEFGDAALQVDGTLAKVG